MKCAVTGVTGFTGYRLAERLRSDGHDVIGLVRHSSRTERLDEVGLRYQRVDFFDTRSVDQALADCTHVFHIAAAYRTEGADVSEFTRGNVDLTRMLLERSKALGVRRFIHCSTGGVQGRIDDPPADENYRTRPGDHYQESKLRGEQLAIGFNTADLETTVVRPIGIYGPGDTRFLKLFNAIHRGLFVMIGTGKTLYHMTYIDDLVDGFLLAATSPRAPGEIFMICGPRYTTLNELVAEIAHVVGRPPPRLRIPLAPVLGAAHVVDAICKRLGVASPLYPRRVEFFQLDRAFTCRKAREMLGYEPKVDLRQGLEMTAAWYRQQGLI